uniref:Uncharacterized protein n=2 Tax=Lotus japonicus TaxID=34305 RepID=I3SR26_LOTJA|nr:unknown [Lotus japonicus]
MPSFYQEPPPPRVELKKIPTTRAKSPKLGRNKSSTEGNTNSSARQVRASLDEKVFQNNPTKGINPVQQKKPLRRSLPPRLTAERISSSKPATVRTSSKAVNGEKTLSNSTGEEKVEMIAATDENNSALSNETSEALPLNVETVEVQPHVNHEIVIEEKPLVASVQESIAAEH